MLSETDLTGLILIRRHLHQYPELSRAEVLTADYISARLTDLGLHPERDVGGHGVVATVRGRRPGPDVGLRADMDALAITELTGLAWQSQHPDVMHACGHDGHMTILLGAAMILQRSDFAGQVHLIFQPA